MSLNERLMLKSYLTKWTIKVPPDIHPICLCILLSLLITCSTPQNLIKPKSGLAIASWYGPKFHGRATSSGEIFNMYAISCAHRTLPFGTRVKITNRINNRSLIVRVNDRGPFVPGREFDLSYGAARELGFVGAGVIEIHYECLDIEPGSRTANESYTIQVGSFVDLENAQQVKLKLSQEYSAVFISEYIRQGTRYFRVRIGNFSNRPEAERLAKIIAGQGHQTLVVQR
ncbi:septal ring lytic transglycosylase RlpA family protein [candidate division CSSED10-310 bacterium]|uniref:Probable endolytic peptidoglycan transglycosylase RlpA n=1 Tax=candidate division CSSED10-310 bacterium TaxID=2855610 RepID=A0ABV6Z066_UNCC1